MPCKKPEKPKKKDCSRMDCIKYSPLRRLADNILVYYAGRRGPGRVGLAGRLNFRVGIILKYFIVEREFPKATKLNGSPDKNISRRTQRRQGDKYYYYCFKEMVFTSHL